MLIPDNFWDGMKCCKVRCNIRSLSYAVLDRRRGFFGENLVLHLRNSQLHCSAFPSFYLVLYLPAICTGEAVCLLHRLRNSFSLCGGLSLSMSQSVSRQSVIFLISSGVAVFVSFAVELVAPMTLPPKLL